MTIKRIFSAGGIIIRPSLATHSAEASRVKKATEGKQAKPQWEVLVTQHSGHKGWDFPKGHREIYESEEQTALREVKEEVGVKAEIIERVGETRYFYYEEGERVLKTVVFYLMKYKRQRKASTAFEVSAQVWLPIDKVESKLTFKDTKELWKKAKEKIKHFDI